MINSKIVVGSRYLLYIVHMCTRQMCERVELHQCQSTVNGGGGGGGWWCSCVSHNITVTSHYSNVQTQPRQRSINGVTDTFKSPYTHTKGCY